LCANARYASHSIVRGNTTGGPRVDKGWISRKARVSCAIGGVFGILGTSLCYVGWCGQDPQWDAALEYPSRGSARHQARETLTSAEVCGSCHRLHFEQWKRSAMARSAELGEGLLSLYATGLALRGAPDEDLEYCLECHAPAAVLGAEPDLRMTSSISREGVSCDICHTAVVTSTDASPGGLQLDPTGPKRGPLPGTTLSLSRPAGGSSSPVARSSFHETLESELHKTSELCASCHMSMWPTNGLPIDWTYAEWKRSPYAERGVHCQDCHMPTYAGRAAPGAPHRETLHRHDFPGGSDLQMVRSTASLTIESQRYFAAHEVSISVENIGAGHAFPTGDATAPTVALEIKAFSANSQLVFEDHRDYRLIYEDAAGDITNDPTAAVRLRSDTTLQPLETRHERFYLAKKLGATRVEAQLVYRRWGEHLSQHDRLAREFIGRYLAEGIQLHQLPIQLVELARLAPTLIDNVKTSPAIVVQSVARALVPWPDSNHPDPD